MKNGLIIIASRVLYEDHCGQARGQEVLELLLKMKRELVPLWEGRIL